MFKKYKFTHPSTWSCQCRPQHQWRSHPPQERTLPAPQLLTRFPVLVKPLFNCQINLTQVDSTKCSNAFQIASMLLQPRHKGSGSREHNRPHVSNLTSLKNDNCTKWCYVFSNVDNRKESLPYISKLINQSMVRLNAFVLRSCKGRNFKYLIRSTLPILLICLGWLSFTNTEFLHEESRYHHWAIAIAPPAQSWPGWDGQHAQIHPRHCCHPLLEDPEHMVHLDLELRLRCSFFFNIS